MKNIRDMMEVRDLSFAYGDQPVLRDMNFAVPAGKITTVLGANGSGKSTLFHLMTKNLKARSGSILLEGQTIEEIKLLDFARRVAIVGQSNTAPGDIKVEELVSYGRTPFRSFSQRFRTRSEEDERLISRAMEIADVEKYRDRQVGTLSGGQKQRVWIAMALAQNTKLLFLDEPTAFLDIRYQVRILKLIRRLNREYGVTVMMVLHDMNQAIRYSDSILGLKDGAIVCAGPPDEVFTSDMIEKIYGIRLETVCAGGNRFVLQV
ncbi:ABC transporter ATP-binding protein [Clostridia bacterium]|nr:ABC transporter ATP-binding protein [Clostridia bacterium]